MSHNRAYKEKSSIKLSDNGGRSKVSPRADAGVEPPTRIVLEADDFDRFEKCMKTAKKPNKLMLEAIALHKSL
jgi:hypothetical protein